MKKKASSCSPFLILVIVILIPSMEASHAYYGYPAGGLAHAYNTPHAYYEAPHHEYHEKPQPYNFGYKIDDGYGNKNYQEEAGDSYGHKKGSYGFTDAHGVYRKVDYVADEHGFRAKISTNEPGTASADPANVHIDSKPVHVVPLHHAPAYHAPVYSEEPHHAHHGHHYEPHVYHHEPHHHEPHHHGEYHHEPHHHGHHYEPYHHGLDHGHGSNEHLTAIPLEPYHYLPHINKFAPPPTPYLPHKKK